MTEEDDPSPVPLDGISAMVVISTPEVTPVILIDSLTSSCSISSKSSTSSIFEYETLTKSSNLRFTVTWMCLSIAAEVTMPPEGSEFENQSRSVPPPQNDTRSGVRLIIINTGGGTPHIKPTVSRQVTIVVDDNTYDLVTTGSSGERCLTS